MTVAELIEMLQEWQNKYGNLKIWVKHDNDYYVPPSIGMERFLLGTIEPFFVIFHEA